MDADYGGWLQGGITVALALGAAILLLRLGTVAFERVAPHDAEAVPLMRVGGIGAGLALGAALLLASPDPGIFLPGRVFLGEAPWDSPLATLLAGHALPRSGTMARLLGAMGGGGGLAAIAGWIAWAGLVLGAVMAVRLWHGPERARAFAAFLLLAVHWAAFVLLGAHVAAWLTARMGFWVFALLLLLFQRHRYARRPAH
jgi:hypothetical protein